MTDHLDTAFAALADPTRRAILAQLARGEMMVTDLARPFALSQPAISRHIKVLDQAGLIRRRTLGTKRMCSLQAPVLGELEQWLSLLRRALEANYARLDELLATLEPDTQTFAASATPADKHTQRKKKNGT